MSLTVSTVLKGFGVVFVVIVFTQEVACSEKLYN